MRKIYLFLSILFISSYAQFGLTQTAGITSGGIYKIKSKATGKLLNVNNAALSTGANVNCWTDTNSDAERWMVTHVENNTYTLENIGSKKFLHITNATPSAGLNVDQSDNQSNTIKWNIVNEGDGSYGIRCFINTGLSLDLSEGSSVDGANIQLWTNNGLDPQKWILEKVTAQSVAPTDAIADKAFADWKAKTYYVDATGGHFYGNTANWAFWGVVEMMEIALDAYETTGNAKYKTMFTDFHNGFINDKGADWMWNEYNDDIMWAVILYSRAYLMFGDAIYLQKAQSHFDGVYARAWDTSFLDGGMWWKTDNSTKNACINGPAAVAACYLGQATGNTAYYDKAIAIYQWQRTHLYTPTGNDAGKVYDSWNTSGSINYWSSTYNQGTYLGAAVMLYNYTKNQTYLTDAINIAQYTKNKIYNSGVMNNEEGGGDLPGFKGIFMRYVRRFIVDCNNTDLIPWLQTNAKVAYNNRNTKGLMWTKWNARTDEVTDYSAFSLSTAVSLMINCPQSTSIIKDAYSTIQAEDFDYIKGVITENCADEGGTKNLGGVQNGYYTAYYNVDFGSNGAKSAEFRLSSGAAGGTIEIRLGSTTGKLIGTAIVGALGSWSNYTTVTCDVLTTSGLQNVYLIYKGTDYVCNLNHFKFIEDNSEKVATVYKDCNFTGNPINLEVGTYTLAQLQARGILDNDISSIKVLDGYKVTLYDGDNFTGTSLKLTADNSCLVGNNFNDIVTSLEISRVYMPESDYETTILPFTGFEGSSFEIVSNPSKTGINTSDNVGKSTKGTLTYSGITSTTLDSKLDFSTNKVFKLKVYSPIIGTMLFKLENSADGSQFVEMPVTNTKTNEWEELSFDFSAAASDTYDKITLFFNFGSTAVNDFYFDDLKQINPLITSDEVFRNNDLVKIYPNPATDVIFIQSEENTTICIYDMLGQIKYKGRLEKGTNNIDVSKYNNGMYIVKISTNESFESFVLLRKE